MIIATACLLGALANRSFFAELLKAYPPIPSTVPMLTSMATVVVAALALLLAITAWRAATKPVLILVLLVSASTAYFVDNFGIVISDDMLRNALQTHPAEVADLITLKLLAYIVLLGVLPSWWVWRTPLARPALRRELVARVTLIGVLLAFIAVSVLAFGSFYASLRDQRQLRTYVNPAYALYSTIKLARSIWTAPSARAPRPVGTDARIPEWDQARDLIILVIGETARADHFSLNGYPRETNPKLAKAGVLNIRNARACGTSTAVSVPCMFGFSGEAAHRQTDPYEIENVIDVLRHAGVNVLWLDNNSSSKGIADRVDYLDFRSPQRNPVCDTECRDEGMLPAVQDYIDSHPTGDILVVLHQMGNHGPAYFKRYPAAFERFVPTCKEIDLSRCSREEIVNAYDNAILYTDHFLDQVIALLRRQKTTVESAMIYVSDHGESLGENGIYLHGMPKALAPEAQLHVPWIIWLGRDMGAEFDTAALAAHFAGSAAQVTHDSLPHLLLGLFEVRSQYRTELDFLTPFRHKAMK